MITQLAFIAVPVSDLDRARRFYEAALELQVTHEASSEWIEFDLGDTTFVLTTADAEHPAGAKGVTLAFEVGDLDTFLAALLRRGLPHGPPIETHVCRSVTINDPDGHELIIHQRKQV